MCGDGASEIPFKHRSTMQRRMDHQFTYLPRVLQSATNIAAADIPSSSAKSNRQLRKVQILIDFLLKTDT